MVILHNFVFFVIFLVVPRGTAAPVLLKWFVSRDVPTGAPFSNGTIIPIPIPSFTLLFYLHLRKLIRSADGAKKVVLVRANRPILLLDRIGRSSSETRARNALFRFVLVLHFLLLKYKGDFSYLESFCGVLRLLFFGTFFFLPRERSLPVVPSSPPAVRSAKRERARRRRREGQTLRPNLQECFHLFCLVIGAGFMIGGCIETAHCDGLNAFSPPPSPVEQLPEEPLTPPEAAPVPQPVPQPVVIPQLAHPLIPDDMRGSLLFERYSLLNLGGDGDPQRLVSIIDTQVVVERHIEAALVDDGFHPNSIMARFREIRGYIHSPRGELLSRRTYESYVTQIMERGTRQSVPYRRILRAIQNYDILL
uniref:Cytochrome c maturation subunit Fc1 n=1 Tax=Calystegia soldanella TaxID=136204 RepID=UPI001EE03F97|nr:Cytochrome c maturation subunit Fc1 [Calystegia soldanella]UJP67883.1 Cytochrome c maturation subunit Fc1 [Calystegia soldanella]